MNIFDICKQFGYFKKMTGCLITLGCRKYISIVTKLINKGDILHQVPNESRDTLLFVYKNTQKDSEFVQSFGDNYFKRHYNALKLVQLLRERHTILPRTAKYFL